MKHGYMLINNYGDISLIGKAVVLKTTSTRGDTGFRFESEYLLQNMVGIVQW